MQDLFRCEARVDVVATTSCKKLVMDMHYETRIQAIVIYHGSVLGDKVTKQQARTMLLTRDQYLQLKSCMFGTSTPCMNFILSSHMHFMCLLCR
jgi:hypothetical protein